MASFALLNEEKKILRRKEKELERQQKINEIKAQPVPVHQGKWADASDDEELNIKAPISDSDTDSEHEAEITEAPPVQDWEQRETNGAKVPEKDQAAPSGGKNKKEAKKPVKPDDEDLDAILGELGIDLPQESQGGASSSKKNRKKKDKEAENGEGEGTGGYPDAAKEEKAEKAKQAKAKEDEKKASKEKENGDNGDEKVLDEAAKQAALEALKKKKAAAGKKGAPSDAVKAAAAEAKKRAEQKKTKKDKSMYDR